MTEGICAKPEAAMMPPPGAHGAVVNGGSWVGPVCCHLNSAGHKENTSAGAPVLHPLDNAASLLRMGTTQSAVDTVFYGVCSNSGLHATSPPLP